MAYKPAWSEAELHRRNFQAIRTWISEHKGRLKAPPNKTLPDIREIVDGRYPTS